MSLYNKYVTAGFFLFIILFSSLAFTQSKEKKVDEQASNAAVFRGNRSYFKTDFESAKSEYQKGLEANPLNAKASFNMGNAFYQLKTWESARASYSNTVNNPKAAKATKAKSFHNIGNTYLEENKYKEAIEAYKSSLRLNPNSHNTKYNLAYAQQKLKQQQDQNKDNKENKEKQDPQDNKDDQKDNKQNQQDKGDNKEQDKGDQDKKEEKKEGEPQPRNNKQKEMEAKLNALSQQEKKIQERKNGEKGYIPSQQKDW